jgi:hypothetical protein
VGVVAAIRAELGWDGIPLTVEIVIVVDSSTLLENDGAHRPGGTNEANSDRIDVSNDLLVFLKARRNRHGALLSTAENWGHFSGRQVLCLRHG